MASESAKLLRRRLTEIAGNLWWTWTPEVIHIFRDIDPHRWRAANHNPIVFLDGLTDDELATQVEGKAVLSRINFQFWRLREYLAGSTTFGEKHAGALSRNPVAYFSAEFGLHESLPIYSGGLGMLAGDHLKSASDLNVPLVGVGLFYSHGYFSQFIDETGWQRERYGSSRIETMPIRQVRRANGKPLRVSVRAGENEIQLRVWELVVGRVRLFLLDSDIEDNEDSDREMTRFLYGGGEGMRLRQEIILGIGGYRALRAMGIRPGVLHLNEGHSAFAPLEATLQRSQNTGESFHTALETVKAATAFTTHTPVEAGHDRFPENLMEENLGWLASELGVSFHELMALGRVNPEDLAEPFCMTVLAIKSSTRRNAVSALHGDVSRRMWKRLWPGREEAEVPIGHITNGVHVKSWLAPSMSRLYLRHMGKEWETKLSFPEFWEKILAVGETELWEEHSILRHQLIDFVRRRVAERQARLHDAEHPPEVEVLDGDVLTIGFSRRFATYKRATLLFSDLARLDAIVNDARRPAQLIFAGKAHPRDDAGKRLVQEIVDITNDPRFERRIVFVEDYDMSVARHLVQGVDLWLNTPERPKEACGTSGQKVLLNGGLNCSILDGWWAEAADGLNGFIVGTGEAHTDASVQRERDASALYLVLEEEVIPEYYDRDVHGVPTTWVRRVKHAIKTLGWRYNSDRMVKDYLEHVYLPCARGMSCEF